MSLNKSRELLVAKCKANPGVSYCLVLVDSERGMRPAICTEAFTLTDEFDAYLGEVIETCVVDAPRYSI